MLGVWEKVKNRENFKEFLGFLGRATKFQILGFLGGVATLPNQEF